MALSNQALALFSISTLLFSTFAHLAVSTSLTTTLRSYISASPTSSPSPSPSPSESTNLFPHDVKAQMSRYIEVTMQATVQKIDAVSVELKKRLDDPKTSSMAKECIQQCTEVYDSAKEDIVVGNLFTIEK